jgi:hypothetical protein
MVGSPNTLDQVKGGAVRAAWDRRAGRSGALFLDEDAEHTRFKKG